MTVHPDNTAWRAVDACGGIYTPAEEASGFAAGHRAALASAMVSVGHADGITTALLDAAKLALPTGVALDNRNIPDDFVVPLDVTMGDLRKIAAAIARATQSPATEGGGE